METNLQLKLLKQALGWWVTLHPRPRSVLRPQSWGVKYTVIVRYQQKPPFTIHTTDLALSHLQVQGMDVSISSHCSAEHRTRLNVHILTKAWILIFQHFTNQCCNLHWRKGNFNWWILSNFARLKNFKSKFNWRYWGFYHGCIKLAYISLSNSSLR